MSGPKHTAGEWALDMVPNSPAFGVAAGRALGVSAKNKGGYRVPVVVWRGIAKPASPEGQANARLIAAAPDLLEALRALESVAKYGGLPIQAELADARAAIAKASGADT